GSEIAGVITEVGPAVNGLHVGDRILAVTGSGAFATEVVLTQGQSQMHVVPDEMPFAQAAAFDLTHGTAYHGLIRRGRLQPGETMLVNGATGGCGSAAIQIAKAS